MNHHFQIRPIYPRKRTVEKIVLSESLFILTPRFLSTRSFFP